MTAGEKTRLHSEPFGVRAYIPGKCYQGYTLFSPAWGDQEYLIDMRGLLVHTWKVTHSNVAELLPNGHLFTHNCGELAGRADSGQRDRLAVGGRRFAGKSEPPRFLGRRRRCRIACREA